MSRFSRLASSLAEMTDQLGYVPIGMRRCSPAARYTEMKPEEPVGKLLSLRTVRMHSEKKDFRS